MMDRWDAEKNNTGQDSHQLAYSMSSSSEFNKTSDSEVMSSVSPQALPEPSEPEKFTISRSSTVLTWNDARNHLYKDWFWECVCCHVALLVLTVILILLNTYDGKTLSAGPQILTKNTLIAILVTIMKALLAVPLAEGISQLKWSWFGRDQRLKDMDTFDQASRGAFGASRLIVQHPWQLASVGGVLILAGLAVGPFSQQVIQSRSRTVSSPGTATVPVCQAALFSDYDQGAGPGQNQVTLPTMGAIYSGIFQTNLERQVSPLCDTGNCTFPTYQSLGFCSQCADVTTQAIRTCSDQSGCTYQLPSGLFLSTFTDTTINATASGDLLTIKDFPSVSNFSAITVPGNNRLAEAKAIECAIWPCVKTYSGSVKGGQFTESSEPSTETTSTVWPLSLRSNQYLYLTPSRCYQNRTVFSPPYQPDQLCNYSIDAFSLLSIRNSLSPLLTGSGSRLVANRPTWSQPTMEALYKSITNESSIASMASIATSLTTHARSGVCNAAVPGTAWVDEIYISVRWNWVILPIVVVALTVAFFVTTVIRTWDQPVWKSSSLALLWYGLEEESRDESRRSMGGMRVKLEEKRNGGWRLVEK